MWWPPQGRKISHGGCQVTFLPGKLMGESPGQAITMAVNVALNKLIS